MPLRFLDNRVRLVRLVRQGALSLNREVFRLTPNDTDAVRYKVELFNMGGGDKRLSHIAVCAKMGIDPRTIGRDIMGCLEKAGALSVDTDFDTGDYRVMLTGG